MDSDIYLDYNTIVHRLDARTKIFLFLLGFVAIMQFRHPLWLLPAFCLILLELGVGRALKNMLRIRHVLIVMTISSLVLWSLFSKGETPLFWFVEKESLTFAFSRTILMLSFISMGMALISTTRNEELVMGLIKIGMPYRVGFAISTALRMVPLIATTTQTISQAQRSRGLDLESGNLLERLRKFIPLLIPVFISTIRGTNVFGMALESKGFGAREKRTYYLKMQMKTADYAVLAFAVLFTIASIYLNFAGYGEISGLISF